MLHEALIDKGGLYARGVDGNYLRLCRETNSNDYDQYLR